MTAVSKRDDPVGFTNEFIRGTVPGIYEGFGIRIVELESGRAVATVPIATNGNHLGTMYAGALFGVAEVLGGALAIVDYDTDRFLPTVKDLQISFRRPATTDVRGEASLDAATRERMRREVESSGRSEFVVDAVLVDAAGTVVATTHGVYQVRAVR
ncbi:PaaI family thioesterase [Gordonia phthalatica]|uniref:Thioesterase n=1 Tax=Gordonia phthalatica TaxID=1136941 RepID=A0A0N9N9A6_9ACTN|nr:YiiD C-terminal domain-containing protein [Gordonia phthalatica]ALG83964.1 hypothetical protein ACH46_04855 [Gordonia phthalatica]